MTPDTKRAMMLTSGEYFARMFRDAEELANLVAEWARKRQPEGLCGLLAGMGARLAHDQGATREQWLEVAAAAWDNLPTPESLDT